MLLKKTVWLVVLLKYIDLYNMVQKDNVKTVNTIPKYLGKVVSLPNGSYMEVSQSIYDSNMDVTILMGTTYKFGYNSNLVISVTGVSECILNKWDIPKEISFKEFTRLLIKHTGIINRELCI